jgi:hypothetical protein
MVSERNEGLRVLKAQRHWDEALGPLADYDDPRAEGMRERVANALWELDSA